MKPETGPDEALAFMLETVARILTSGPEDATLVLDNDWLLLSRFAGVLRKHRRDEWWEHHGFVNAIIHD